MAGKNKWGVSIQEVFDTPEDAEKIRMKPSAVYYYGADGTHAVVDVTEDSATLIVNGNAEPVEKSWFSNQLDKHNIDIKTGWSQRP